MIRDCRLRLAQRTEQSAPRFQGLGEGQSTRFDMKVPEVGGASEHQLRSVAEFVRQAVTDGASSSEFCNLPVTARSSDLLISVLKEAALSLPAAARYASHTRNS